MTDDTTATDEGTGSDNQTIDIRTDDDKETDAELDALLQEYQKQKEGDGPVDENLQQLAEKHERKQAADGDSESAHDGDDGGDPDTGETTVRIGEEVDPDDADFVDDPSDEEIEAVATSDDAKARRRAEREQDDETAATRSAGDQTGGPDTAAKATDEAVTASDLADEYDIDTDARDDVAAEPDHDAEPNVDATELGPTSAEEVASYDDIADEGVLPEVDVDDDFDFEDQDPDAVSDRPDPRTIALPTKGDEELYVRLGAPDDDACINIVEAMQAQPGLEERMEVVVRNVVDKPSWVPDRMDEWPFGVRMSLFGECTRQLGLEDLQDFQ